LAEYVAGREPQLPAPGYDPHLCESAVAALRPGELSAFKSKEDSEKRTFCTANFSELPPWEGIPETRHLVVARAAPEQLATYEKLAAEDERVQFCFRLFGASGVVWTEPYRAAIRAEAMKALGRKQPFSEQQFLQTMGNHWLEMNGIHYASAAEVRKQGMEEYLLLQTPVPIGMARIRTAAVMKLAEEARAQRERERRAKEVSPLKTLESLAGKSPETEAEVQRQFTATLPGDRMGDLQLRQAALWLSASEAVLRSTVWPTPASEVYVSEDIRMRILVVAMDGDPARSAKWESWSPKERTEEVSRVVRLIASASERVLNATQNAPAPTQGSGQALTELVSPELIRRYFPQVADQKMDDAARERLMRAAAVADAAFLILFMTSDPVL
jgi:hypothetical protein